MRKQPCFYLFEGSVGLQLCALKKQSAVPSNHAFVGLNRGPYFQCAMHIVTADRLDNAST